MSKTTTPRRVYAVRHIATGTTRLVRAVNAATVVRTDYTAEVASQDDLIDLLSAGTRVEYAGADDPGGPPVKVLRVTSAAAKPPPERDQRVPDMFNDAPAADHVEDVLAMVPEVAAEQPGEPAEPVALAASAQAGAEPGSSASGADDAPAAPADSELKRQAEAATARAGGKIVAKFRDPATGQTWTGRGLRPRWLVQALEGGRTLDEFLIDAQGEQA